MTHIYLKKCDLCGKIAEMNSIYHAGSIRADIMMNNNSIYREEFDVCAVCLNDSGLADILWKMKHKKDDNKSIVKHIQKIFKKELIRD